MKGCDELMPELLAFVTGVADSEDSPMNISHEKLIAFAEFHE